MKELNHILASNEELIGAMAELVEYKSHPWLSDERKAQVSRQLSYVVFELNCRDGIVLLDDPQESSILG